MQITKMPVIFVGHGSPMNAIETNQFTQGWQDMAKRMPQPKAILAISAHWYIPDTQVTAMDSPKTIHDFYGFPQALFDVQYPAPGAPELAHLTAETVLDPQITLDQDWGLDHGTWSVLKLMYPDAQVPVYQLSIDYRQSGDWYLRLGQELHFLREQGVLILGSGNLVHNLGQINYRQMDGYDWALSFQSQVHQLIQAREDQQLARYQDLGRAAQLAIPTPEHFLPLLYILGATDKAEPQFWFNQACVMGSISMDSIVIGAF